MYPRSPTHAHTGTKMICRWH